MNVESMQCPMAFEKKPTSGFSKVKCSYSFFLGWVVASLFLPRCSFSFWCVEIPASLSHIFLFINTDDNTLHGPVFLQEPSSMIFPLDSEEKKVKLNCEVKGNPRPTVGFVECLTAPWHHHCTTVMSSFNLSPAHVTQSNSAVPLGFTQCWYQRKRHQACAATHLHTIAKFGSKKLWRDYKSCWLPHLSTHMDKALNGFQLY